MARHSGLFRLRVAIGGDWSANAFPQDRARHVHAQALLAKNGITPLLRPPVSVEVNLRRRDLACAWYKPANGPRSLLISWSGASGSNGRSLGFSKHRGSLGGIRCSWLVAQAALVTRRSGAFALHTLTVPEIQ